MGTFMSRRGALWCVAVMSFLVALDSSIVETILPKLAEELETQLHVAVLVVSTYLLAINATLLIAGASGDRWPKSRLFSVGVALFGASSLVCACAPGVQVLLVGRALQGVGAAIGSTLGAAWLVEQLRPSERASAFGTVATAVAFGYLVGPTAGGLAFDWFGWRSLFFINIPLCIALALGASAASTTLPAPKRAPPFDLVGAVSVVAFVLALSIAVPRIFAAPFSRWAPLVLVMALGAVGIGWSNRRAQAPVFDLRLFAQNVPFLLSNVVGFLSFTGGYMLAIGIPFFVSTTLGASASQLGLLLTCFPLGFVLASPVGGLLARRSGTLAVVAAQGVVTLGSVLALLLLEHDVSGMVVAALSVVIGLGRGLFVAPYNTVAMGQLAPRDLAAGAGALGLARNMGMMVGTGLAGAFTARLGHYDAAGLATNEQLKAELVSILSTIFAGATAVATVALVASVAIAHLDSKRTAPLESPR